MLQDGPVPTIELGLGGWVVYSIGRSTTVRVRFTERPNGRLVVSEIHLGDDAGLTAELLRSVPIGMLETMANSPAMAAEFRSRLAAQSRAVEQATGRWLRSVTTTRTDEQVHQSFDEPPLELPDAKAGGKRGDDFYEAVAKAFVWLSQHERGPAQVLAERNGIPVTTAHRWVKEARRRGRLAPARRGA